MLSSKVYPFDLSNNNEFEKLKHHNPDIILPKEAYKASTIVIEDDINPTDVRKFSPGKISQLISRNLKFESLNCKKFINSKNFKFLM